MLWTKHACFYTFHETNCDILRWPHSYIVKRLTFCVFTFSSCRFILAISFSWYSFFMKIKCFYILLCSNSCWWTRASYNIMKTLYQTCVLHPSPLSKLSSYSLLKNLNYMHALTVLPIYRYKFSIEDNYLYYTNIQVCHNKVHLTG